MYNGKYFFIWNYLLAFGVIFYFLTQQGKISNTCHSLHLALYGHLAFLDDQRVLIAHFDDCAAARNFQNEVNWIALATIVVVALLGFSSLVGLCLYRQHRRANEDQLDLVDHMSPQPYNLTTPEQR